MFRALFLKEFREVWWTGPLALLPMLYSVAKEVDFGSRTSGSGYTFLRVTETYVLHTPPLIDGGFARSILLCGSLLAGFLGLWQTFRETQSRTWHFLLYRPVQRSHIFRAKAAAAATVFGFAIILPALAVLIWAATPGTHASPFHWTLASPVCYAIAVGPVIYLAALFVGLRRSHLLGSRWWPLIGVVTLFALLPNSLPHHFTLGIWLMLLIASGFLTATIQDELRLTDFS